MKIIKRDLDVDIDKLTIIPISDVHIGDKTANLKAFKEVLERIKSEPNTYTILNGDLCNIALKNSKSDVYSDELTPMEQVLQIINFLEPIKDKILVMSNGNHEDRITKDTSIDILYLVAKQLRIEQVYSPSWWYLYLTFGKTNKNRPALYTISGYHGGNSNGSNENINVLVLDTEVYSNTGGQASKSTRSGAIAKFDSIGKKTTKKDLAKMMMTYPNVYVAEISMGANMNQAIKAINEAMNHDGPSMIIAYAPCISHGIKGGMGNSIKEEELAVKCGYFPLFRYNSKTKEFNLDYKEPDFTLYDEFLSNETRYKMISAVNLEHAKELLEDNLNNAKVRFEYYKLLEKSE